MSRTISIPRLWVPRPRVFKIPMGEWLELFAQKGKLRRNPSTGKYSEQPVAPFSKFKENTGTSDDDFDDCCGCPRVPVFCPASACEWCGGSPHPPPSSPVPSDPNNLNNYFPQSYEAVVDGTSIASSACYTNASNSAVLTGGSADGTYEAAFNCNASATIRSTMAGGSIGTGYLGASCTGTSGAINRIQIGGTITSTGYFVDASVGWISGGVYRESGSIFGAALTVGPEAKRQVDDITIGGTVEIGDIFTINYTNHAGSSGTVTFTATAATIANAVAGLVSAWNTLTTPPDHRYFTTATTAGLGTAVRISSIKAGVAFTITSVSTTDLAGAPSDGQTITHSSVTPNGANTKDCYAEKTLTDSRIATNFGVSPAVIAFGGNITFFACFPP